MKLEIEAKIKVSRLEPLAAKLRQLNAKFPSADSGYEKEKK
jgi:hypothetical protein